MKGRHRIVVKNNRIHYEFEIKRNITIIQGDSATGKTTLINMLRQAENLGRSSGIDVICDVPCRVLEGQHWKLILESLSGSIIFIDEENAFINTEEFAAAIQGRIITLCWSREKIYITYHTALKKFTGCILLENIRIRKKLISRCTESIPIVLICQ